MAQAKFDSWTSEPTPNTAIVFFTDEDMVIVRRELAKDPEFLTNLINSTLFTANRIEKEKQAKLLMAKAQGWGSFDQQVGAFKLA